MQCKIYIVNRGSSRFIGNEIAVVINYVRLRILTPGSRRHCGCNFKVLSKILKWRWKSWKLVFVVQIMTIRNTDIYKEKMSHNFWTKFWNSNNSWQGVCCCTVHSSCFRWLSRKTWLLSEKKLCGIGIIFCKDLKCCQNLAKNLYLR